MRREQLRLARSVAHGRRAATDPRRSCATGSRSRKRSAIQGGTELSFAGVKVAGQRSPRAALDAPITSGDGGTATARAPCARGTSDDECEPRRTRPPSPAGSPARRGPLDGTSPRDVDDLLADAHGLRDRRLPRGRTCHGEHSSEARPASRTATGTVRVGEAKPGNLLHLADVPARSCTYRQDVAGLCQAWPRHPIALKTSSARSASSRIWSRGSSVGAGDQPRNLARSSVHDLFERDGPLRPRPAPASPRGRRRPRSCRPSTRIRLGETAHHRPPLRVRRRKQRLRSRQQVLGRRHVEPAEAARRPAAARCSPARTASASSCSFAHPERPPLRERFLQVVSEDLVELRGRVSALRSPATPRTARWSLARSSRVMLR